MRYVVYAALAALAFGLSDARPANAAWQCIGPEFVCADAHRDSKGTVKKAKTAHHAAKAARIAHSAARPGKKLASHKTRSHRPSTASSASYSSGGSVGMASYYWEGQRTASGARFNPSAMTAAHRSLPFGTRVLVTHLASGRTVTVTINDRGPFIKGRIIDLSSGAAGVLGIKSAGVARVSVAVVGRG